MIEPTLAAREPTGGSDPAYRAAKEALAHRVRAAAILDVAGPDRVEFLQGQLTQDVEGLAPGVVRPAAGLTPKGKLLYFGRVVGLADRIRLVLPAANRAGVLTHLAKYAAFQKVTIDDVSDQVARVGLYGPRARHLSGGPAEGIRLPGEAEFGGEILAPAGALTELREWLLANASMELGLGSAETLRVEAGRPRFGQDADETHLADEIGLDPAISTTKGCYVGQEIVARLRTYGRTNRRLVGFRFEEGPVAAGTRLRLPEEPEPGKIEQGRVTSSVVSPDLGPIGLGFAFRDVPVGARLVADGDRERSALVVTLPFA